MNLSSIRQRRNQIFLLKFFEAARSMTIIIYKQIFSFLSQEKVGLRTRGRSVICYHLKSKHKFLHETCFITKRNIVESKQDYEFYYLSIKKSLRKSFISQGRRRMQNVT